MLKYITLTLCLISLNACAGSAYNLPQFTPEEVASAQNDIDKNGSSLKLYERSDKQYKNLVSSISSKLRNNAQPICDQAGYSKCHFEVTYIPDDTVNAYASEGYKITLHKGLLQYLKTNDEIAAVIGHEMGHHIADHNSETDQNAAAGAAISGILTAVVFAAATNGTYYSAQQQQQQQESIQDMMKLGAHIGARSYSKEQEREADLLSSYLLARSGYNLNKAQNVMVVLASIAGHEKGNAKSFLESHPAGMERVVSWQKSISEIKNNKEKMPYLKSTSSK